MTDPRTGLDSNDSAPITTVQGALIINRLSGMEHDLYEIKELLAEILDVLKEGKGK